VAETMPTISVELIGLRELETRYSEANYVVRAVMVERSVALAESLKIIFRVHAPRGKDDPLGRPRKDAHLADTIEATAIPGTSSFVVEVGVPPEQANKVTWLREGTRAHSITPTKASALHFWWTRAGVEVFTKHVNHPGTRPNRWEEEAQAASEAVVHEAGLRMGEATAKALGHKVP
jgi:hypothetical protein